MYVYLLYSKSYKRTAWVSLDLQKCMPVVGTHSEARIDPALWFKVLALGSVFVDIDRQKVFWTFERQNLRADNLSEFFNTQEEITSISENGDLDYDVRMAELFGTAREIYSHISADGECNVSTYDDLLKILHVYILPEVQFHSKDRKAIHRVFKVMKNACKTVEMLINKKLDEKQKEKESLARQRRSFLKTELLPGHFTDEEFNWFFFKHIEEDVKKLDGEILLWSNKIHCLKHYESEKHKSELSEARVMITKFVAEKEKLIVVREELKCPESNNPLPSVGRSKSLTKKNQITARQTWYISTSKELENTNEDINTLMNSKIKLSGVREAVHLTLTELDGDGVSVGYNCKKGACKTEADVFDPSKKPDHWKTLEEQVDEHLRLDDSKLKSEHDQFCSSIKEKCCKLLNTNSMSSFTSEVISFINSRLGLGTEEECKNGTFSKEDCGKICSEVSKHIQTMADKLVEELHGTHSYLLTYYTHVYICYEKHVSEDIMAALSEVYKESSRSKCEHLHKWISSCATSELAFIDILIKKLFPDLNKCDSQTTENLPLNSTVNSTKDDPVNSGKQAVSKDDVIRLSYFDFFHFVRKENTTFSIFDKLGLLSDAFRFVEKHSCDLLRRNGHSTELSTDEMSYLLIFLVCKLDSECFVSLYADVNMIIHLAPGFLQGSKSPSCLTTLTEVYKYLFEDLHTYWSKPIFV